MENNLTCKMDCLDFKCAICYNFMLQPSILEPCQHRFCKECVQTLFLEKHQCPLCRAEVKKSEDAQF